MPRQLIVQPIGTERSHLSSDETTRELAWRFTGLETILEAEQAALLEAPEPYNNLIIKDLDAQEVSYQVWDVTVFYGRWEEKDEPEEGTAEVQITIAGETEHITHAKEHIKTYPADADEHDGAIGVTGDGSVEGADIIVPKYSWVEIYHMSDAAFTVAYRKKVKSLVGKTNAAEFKGFAANEVLFLGGGASKKGKELWRVEFQFIQSDNVEGLAIADILNIVKKGHELLWVKFADEEDTAVPQPEAVHIERVYDEGDFGDLGLPD